MAKVREEHSREGIRVSGGGLKEFYYTKGDLERIQSTDTKSTKEFKKWYYTDLFYKGNYNAADLIALKERVHLFKLNIIAYNKKHMQLRNFFIYIKFQNVKGDYVSFFSKKCKNEFLMELPENKYKVTVNKKILLFFKKSLNFEINLIKDIKKEIIL